MQTLMRSLMRSLRSGLGRKPKAKPASVKQEPTEATMREASHA